MIISVHIPKCAGTSFRHLLQALYGDQLWLNYGTIFTREQADRAAVVAGAECIHGHFFADAFDDLFPDRTLITWVRHPVERVVSNYYHFLRSPDMRDDCCRALYEHGLTLRQFAELDWMRNEATRYLTSKALDEFAFVGITERFPDSLHLFSRTFGWPSSLPAPYVNTNPDRTTDCYILPPDDYAHILALNSIDLAWYECAVNRLEVQLAADQACAT